VNSWRRLRIPAEISVGRCDDDAMVSISGGLAIVGGGKIGEALVAGLLRESGGGLKPDQIVVVESYPARQDYLRQTYGVECLGPAEATRRSTTVIVAVKPQDVDAALQQISGSITAAHLVVSVAAGVTVAQLERGLPSGTSVVRGMPNTPALVGHGMTAISGGTSATADNLDLAEQLLASVGKVVRVSEPQLDAVTAISGSGPAYFFYVVEAMIEAGVMLGLPRPLATELVIQTAAGSAMMLSESGEHPVQLREAVTSPGGTTIAAIRELESHGVRAAFMAALAAARDRSVELGQ
jgi:pyrroline-5-carboxylate reductase